MDLKLEIGHKGFVQTFGYALWGTTAEKIEPLFKEPLCPAGGSVYGIKGTSGAYYFTDPSLATTAPLNATENQSTISQAAAIDNPQPIVGSVAWDGSSPAITSVPPAILGCMYIDIDSARSPAQLTHAFFAETGYQWDGCKTTPAILVGGSIETAARTPAELHQWSFWLKMILHW